MDHIHKRAEGTIGRVDRPCSSVRHDRMERAAAGEVVQGISEETLAEARAQAAACEAKLKVGWRCKLSSF